MRIPDNGSAAFHGGEGTLCDGSKDDAVEGGATSLDLSL
jgi:hypothetical protein